MKLHLGVIDIPYTSYDGGKKAANPKRRGKKAAAAPVKGAARTVSTAQVARWLEDRYHVMEVFYEADGGLADLLTEAVRDAMEDVLMGAPPTATPWLAGTSEIQARFKAFLSNRVIETMGIPGVPTKAALAGYSSRRKKNMAKGKRRPSFIDTGLYQSSFTAWVE